MLTLGLKEGDSVSIGDDIRIQLVGEKGGTYYLGIEAPRKYRILREKLRQQLMENGSLPLKNGNILVTDGTSTVELKSPTEYSSNL